MDLPNPAFAVAQPSNGGQPMIVDSQVLIDIPLFPYQRHIIAHGIIMMLGFLVFLPLGAIVARWVRTFSPMWFTLHWIIQFGIALPLIVTGFALGVTAVNLQELPGGQLNDTHKRWGVALFVLYFVQISFGAIIHFWKPRASLRIQGRTLQNYFHAILGLFIIGAAFYQVRTGIRVEWPLYAARGPLPNGTNIAWIVWLVIVPLVYFGGVLLFLHRQYAQERANRQGTNSKLSMDEPQRAGTY